jgi:hypothetical protein
VVDSTLTACVVPQAQRHTEAAKLLVDTAAQLAAQKAPPLQIKKLYVLAALEVEAFRQKAMAAAGSDGATAAGTMLGTGITASVTRAGKTVAATALPTHTAAAAQTLAGRQSTMLCNVPFQHHAASCNCTATLICGNGIRVKTIVGGSTQPTLVCAMTCRFDDFRSSCWF